MFRALWNPNDMTATVSVIKRQGSYFGTYDEDKPYGTA